MNYDMLIPIIRKAYPQIMAEELASVQPMNGDIFSDIIKMSAVEYIPKQNELIHDFIRGWLRYYGTQYIPERDWNWIMIKTGRK